MKLLINAIENEIVFKEGTINVIEIEDKKYFRTFLNELYNIIELKYETENIILVEKDKKINIAKNVILLFDIFNINFNDKKILSKIYSKIEDNIKLEKTITNKFEEIRSDLLNYVLEQLNELDFEYEINEEFNIQDILKSINLKIDIEAYDDVNKKIMFLIDVISEFETTQILILVNIKNYFKKEELEEIYKYAVYKNVNILVIENNISNEKIKFEEKVYIDADFDDFLIN